VLGKAVPYFLRATLACSAAVLAFISRQLGSSMYFFLLFARHVLGGDISEGSLFGGKRESCPAVKEDGPPVSRRPRRPPIDPCPQLPGSHAFHQTLMSSSEPLCI
jgi:hypothetical protein